jgi:protein ImuA
MSSARMSAPDSDPDRAAVVDELRRLLFRIEGPETPRALSLGLPALDSYLPHGGLACGALHEVGPAAEADAPAAFGFLAALLARIPERAPILLVLPARARKGRPSGQGLANLGLDPSRLIIALTANETETLWATEEAVRSRVPAAVAALIGTKLDLKTSQRLQVAARDAGRPLFLLRPAGAAPAMTASTRWRIAASRAARDRFGLATRWRWRVVLERARNGRPGEWEVEFDHATHRFSLAAALADSARPDEREAHAIRRAG